VNVAKYYRARNRVVSVRRVLSSQNHSAGNGIAPVEKHMIELDFTRRRPSSIKPHSHPHQQPGYRQPSEQQRRRARQLLKGDRR